MMKFTLKRLVKPLLLSMAILSANTQVVRAQAENNKGAATSKEQYHAIFHLDSDSPAGMKKILHNIQNLLEDPRTKGKVRVELLANSKGYEIFKKGNGLESELKALEAQGVILAECQNTLKELKVAPDTLYEFVKLVPSGMGELVIRQSEGWAYLHPSP